MRKRIHVISAKNPRNYREEQSSRMGQRVLVRRILSIRSMYLVIPKVLAALSLLLVFMLSVPAPVRAQISSFRAVTPNPGCLFVASGQQNLAPQPAPPADVQLLTNKEAVRAPTQLEMRLVLATLTAANIQNHQQNGSTIVNSSLLLDRRRGQTLLQDSVLFLAVFHTRETLDRLRHVGGLDPNTRDVLSTRLQNTLQLLDECARRGFENHGGKPALEQSRALVESYRGDLERALFQGFGQHNTGSPIQLLLQGAYR